MRPLRWHYKYIMSRDVFDSRADSVPDMRARHAPHVKGVHVHAARRFVLAWRAKRIRANAETKDNPHMGTCRQWQAAYVIGICVCTRTRAIVCKNMLA